MFRKRIINVLQMLAVVCLLSFSHSVFGDNCTWCHPSTGFCCTSLGGCGMCNGPCDSGADAIGCTSGCGPFNICCVLPDESEIITKPVCCNYWGGSVGCSGAPPNEETEDIESFMSDL